jgi:uncharacterized protein with PQ loop repeat
MVAAAIAAADAAVAQRKDSLSVPSFDAVPGTGAPAATVATGRPASRSLLVPDPDHTAALQRRAVPGAVRAIGILAVVAVAVGLFYSYRINAYNASAACLPDQEADAAAELIGRIFAYVAAPILIGSRPVQLLKSYKAKSAEGLSPTFFAAAGTANFTTLIALCLMSDGWAYVVRKFPWFLCTAIDSCLDALLVTQTIYYQRRARLLRAAQEIPELEFIPTLPDEVGRIRAPSVALLAMAESQGRLRAGSVLAIVGMQPPEPLRPEVAQLILEQRVRARAASMALGVSLSAADAIGLVARARAISRIAAEPELQNSH